jgi:hypothetical protein
MERLTHDYKSQSLPRGVSLWRALHECAACRNQFCTALGYRWGIYLAVIIDLYSRRIAEWIEWSVALCLTIDSDLVIFLSESGNCEFYWLN